MSEIAKGMRFGRLTTVSMTKHATQRGQFWICSCDCGNETTAYAGHLRNGSRVSCGCAMPDSKRRHGMSHSVEHRAWSRMKERCYNPHNKKYHLYGARGIKVCERWLNSFENFLADMGTRPSPEHSIDRIESHGNYEPTNCRWATIEQQNNNRSSNRWVVVDGQRMTVAQASRATGTSSRNYLITIAWWPV